MKATRVSDKEISQLGFSIGVGQQASEARLYVGKKGFVQGAQLPVWGSWEEVGFGSGGEVRRAEGRV